MCRYFHSFQCYKVKVHITVGLICGTVNLGNEVLGSEGETDVAFLKIWTKKMGDASDSRRGFKKLGKFGMTSSLSFLGKKKAILVEPHLVVTCCSYYPDTNLAEQQGIVRPQELRETTGLAPGTMYCSIICTPSSLPEAKWGENLLWHPWLLPTCIAGPDRKRQLENWEPA